jgi:hypothetical protein
LGLQEVRGLVFHSLIWHHIDYKQVEKFQPDFFFAHWQHIASNASVDACFVANKTHLLLLWPV